ncbi:MAG: hypothetical protein KGL39_37225 [Patescibacteria group bacterium]|nr:hypothetical protein [Patescibacteria group bacterium]
MATVHYTWNAPVVAQVNTITPANVASTNTFTVTINGLSITFTAGVSDTVATVSAGLAALLAASTIPEFKEVAWTSTAANVIGTAKTAGIPFTQTSSASGGTATLTTAVATTSSSPTDASVVTNYSTGALPSASDTLVVENSGQNIFYGLTALSAIHLAAFQAPITFTGLIGLPEFSANGYPEYRNQYLELYCDSVSIGTASSSAGSSLGSANGSGRIKIDSLSYQTALVVNGTANPVDSPLEAVQWKGTDTSNTITVNKGTVGVAIQSGETAAVASFVCGYVTQPTTDSWLRFGSGVTLSSAAGTQSGGTLTVQSALDTLDKLGGTLFVLGAATVTALTASTGTTYYQSSGTLTTYYGASGSVLDCSRDSTTRIITNITLYKGASLLDPQQTITFSNGIILTYCRLSDVTLNLGYGVTLGVTY